MRKSVAQDQISLERIVKESYWLLQANFNLIIAFIFCVYIPFHIFEILIPFESLTDEYGKLAVGVLSMVISWAKSILGLLGFTGIAYIVRRSMKGEPRNLVDTLRFSFSRLDDVFWTSVLSNIIFLGLMLLFIIPGIIWANYYSFVMATAALQGIRGKAALDYSKRLVKGQWWKIFGINLVIGLVSLGFSIPLFLVVRNMPEANPLNSLIHSIIVYTLGSIFSVVHVVLFFNVIQVKELQKQNRNVK